MDFTALYKQISPALRRLARTYSGYCKIANADDLYQEMSIYLWDNYKHGMPQGINYAYIVKGCDFFILNYLRKNKDNRSLFSLDTVINENGDTLKQILPSNSEHLHRYLDRKLTFEEISSNGFSRRQKQVLACLADGLTTREAGKKLGISHVMVVKYKKSLIDKWQKKSRGYQNR